MIIFGIYIAKWRTVQRQIKEVTVTAEGLAYEEGYRTALSQVEQRERQAYNAGRADERKQTLAVANKVLTKKE